MENYLKDTFRDNKTKSIWCVIIIVFFADMFMLLINYFTYLHINNRFICVIRNNLIQFFHIYKPTVSPLYAIKIAAVDLMLNALFLSLLTALVYLILDKVFHCKFLNNNMFSKKIKYIVFIFLILQFVLSCIPFFLEK